MISLVGIICGDFQVGEAFSPFSVTRNCSLQFLSLINNEKYKIRHFQVERCIRFGSFWAIWRVKINGILIFATKVIEGHLRSFELIFDHIYSPFGQKLKIFFSLITSIYVCTYAKKLFYTFILKICTKKSNSEMYIYVFSFFFNLQHIFWNKMCKYWLFPSKFIGVIDKTSDELTVKFGCCS